MSNFKDSTGRQWPVTINVGTIRRVRASGVDLLKTLEGQILQQLHTDPIFVVDVAWPIVSADLPPGYTQADFDQAMDGEAIAGASDAIQSALLDFFPPGQKKMLANAMEKIKETKNLAQAQAAQQIQQMNIESILHQNAGNTSSNSPESAESTPTGSPSANSIG